MDEYQENLKTIEFLKTFKGGDNNDTIVDRKIIDDMKYVIDYCNKHHILQPEIFPYADFCGCTAEWMYGGWWVVINNTGNYISIFAAKLPYEYKKHGGIYFYDIENTMTCIKRLFEKIQL